MIFQTGHETGSVKTKWKFMLFVLAMLFCLTPVTNALAGELENKLINEAINNRADAVRALVEKGANVNAKDSEGSTALTWAAYYGNTDVVRTLIEKGADVNVQNDNKQTPLFLAADKGHADVAKILIEKGADINLRDKTQDTPALIADKHNHPEVASLIRKQGRGSAQQDLDTLIKSSNQDLETIVRVARSLNPPPAIPQEARDEMAKGMAAFKLATRPEDFANAEAHFDKASRLAPWLPEPYFNLALSQEKLALARGQQQKFHAANDSIGKYLIVVSDAKDIQAGKQKMAELDLQIRRYDEFANEANTGNENYQKGPSGYNKAIVHLRKAIEMYPDHPQSYKVYSSLADVYLHQGDLDTAYKYMQKSFELMPSVSEIPSRCTNMGVILERRGDRANACIYYKRGCDNGSRVSCDNMRNCP